MCTTMRKEKLVILFLSLLYFFLWIILILARVSQVKWTINQIVNIRLITYRYVMSLFLDAH